MSFWLTNSQVQGREGSKPESVQNPGQHIQKVQTNPKSESKKHLPQDRRQKKKKREVQVTYEETLEMKALIEHEEELANK